MARTGKRRPSKRRRSRRRRRLATRTRVIDVHPLRDLSRYPDPRAKPRPRFTVAPPAATPPRADPPPVAPQEPGVYRGPFGRREAERLLWRAGFGPAPGQAEALAGLGIENAVHSLTRPAGAPRYSGPAPVDDSGNPIAPSDRFGHDLLQWLDRMVRGDQPLRERMALVWHDWFATSNATVGDQGRMLEQYELLRSNWLGSFHTLLREVTRDPAMLVWLNGISNRRGRPDENYARELMELFTLGADRGAYTETDVREMARSLTGFDSTYTFQTSRWDSGEKTVFGRRGRWNWEDACRLCVEHPLHASHLVAKLWAAFVPTAPSAATQAELEGLYRGSGYAVRPVVERILKHPDLYLGPSMVKPPMVFCAGLLRARGDTVRTTAWWYLCEAAGQRVFYPPNVAGWDESRWLDTSTLRGRWNLVAEALSDRYIPYSTSTYPISESPREAVSSALAYWGTPAVTAESDAALLGYATGVLPGGLPSYRQRPYRVLRQNALRQLVGVSPDAQVC